MSDSKTLRRSITALWDGDEDAQKECDRIYIALHCFQTEGKEAYRRIVGMHGRGGGTSDRDFLNNLTSKMNSDIRQHYAEFPDGAVWPGAVPNAAYPTDVSGSPDKAFAYTFCWHGAAPFLLWHRALMAEFERNLQKFDPEYADDDTNSNRHQGPTALGAPYWAWEGWDGETLPVQITLLLYTVKTNAWAARGFPQGSVFINPFHRWFAPVSIPDQMAEQFPPILTDANCTLRSAAFTDPAQSHQLPWPIPPSIPGDTPMVDTVYKAIGTSTWSTFATTGSTQTRQENVDWGVGGGSKSIENPHNKFHNRIGGITQGGLQGSGLQYWDFPGQENEYVGTMTSNQSIFDPLFWLHHGNIERQLMSWQRIWVNNDSPILKESEPTAALMNVILYPWTKPDQLYRGQESWNSEDSPTYNATFGDWWDWKSLRYIYDDYITPTLAERASKPESRFLMKGFLALNTTLPEAEEQTPIHMSVEIERKTYKFGEYTLKLNGRLVGTCSILSALGNACSRCSNENSNPTLHFEVSSTVGDLSAVQSAASQSPQGFTIERNKKPVDIAGLTVSQWYNGVNSGQAQGTKKRARGS